MFDVVARHLRHAGALFLMALSLFVIQSYREAHTRYRDLYPALKPTMDSL